MMLTANHAHVFPGAVREDGTVSALLQHMDACGIEQCVAFAPFPRHCVRKDITPSRWLYEEIRDEQRLLGFGVIDFDRGQLTEQVREIAELGFRGIKLHPAFQHFAVMEERACEVYAAAEKAGLFLSFHTGMHWDRIANYHVLLFDEVAYHYPALRFSMEHIGGYSFFREGLAVLANNDRDRAHPRVFGGLTSVFNHEKNPMWYLRPEEILEALNQVGENAFFFGLDFPYNGIETTRKDLECIRSLPVAQAVKDKILGGNLRRELGLAEFSQREKDSGDH